MAAITTNLLTNNVKGSAFTLFNTIDASVTTSQVVQIGGTEQAGGVSVIMTTDSSFNGTTSTIAVSYSNDGTNYTATTGSVTLGAASTSYLCEAGTNLVKFVKFTYTKGDANAGTLTGVAYLR